MVNLSAAHQLDFYKTGHKDQYPEGTEYVYSNFTARYGMLPGHKGVVFVGLQMFIMDYLIDEWNDSFFYRDIEEVVEEYRNTVGTGLNMPVSVTHLRNLHKLGYLPITIKALPEGTFVPYGVPMLTIVNTLPEFYWLTNMLESVLSAELWQMITSATSYRKFRELFEIYAKATSDNKDFVDFQGHDFSYRGLGGRHAAAKSGLAVLLAGSKGTDTVPAIDLAKEFYGGKGFIAGSIPATEHSVMCAGIFEPEIETFRRILHTYPYGAVSIVSDTWDFWNVVENVLPELKDEIMNREGKLVIRPDSGDPVEIICGSKLYDLDAPVNRGKPESIVKGLIECLWDTFGGTINSKGFKVLDSHIGAIYGDSITFDRAKEILERLAHKGFSSENIVFGIGSYTFQYCTRDTHGMAMKATSVTINDKRMDIYKSPKTDSGKKSAKGLLRVLKDEKGKLFLEDQVSESDEDTGELKVVFSNGFFLKYGDRVTIDEVRKRVLSEIFT